MNNLIWLLRASQWSRHPPSARKVKLVILVIVVALVIVAMEKFGFWPDWATLEKGPRMRPARS